MNKELFTETINALKKQYQYNIQVAENLSKAFPDAFTANLIPRNHYLTNILLKILTEQMNDQTNIIEHYIYETEFGTNNNKIPDITTPKQLYEYLKHNLSPKPKKRETQCHNCNSKLNI